MLFLFNALLSPTGLGANEKNIEPVHEEKPCYIQINRFKIGIDTSAVFDPWAIALEVFPRLRETATSIDIRDDRIEVNASILGPTVVFTAPKMDVSETLLLLQPLLPPGALFEISARLKSGASLSFARTSKEAWQAN